MLPMDWILISGLLAPGLGVAGYLYISLFARFGSSDETLRSDGVKLGFGLTGGILSLRLGPAKFILLLEPRGVPEA